MSLNPVALSAADCPLCREDGGLLIEDGRIDAIKAERYAGWDGEFGQKLAGLDLAGIADLAVSSNLDPKPRSGRQERIENLINRFI